MADVRCPMCGKPNPSEAEVCQFCQARIRPLSSPEFSNTSPPPPAPDPGSRPEPLNTSDEPAVFDEGPQAEQDEPDWLRSLRQDGEVLPSQPATEEEFTEWLAEEARPSFEDPSASGKAGDTGDWLSDLRPAGEMETGETASEAEADRDWLSPGEDHPTWVEDTPSGEDTAGDFIPGQTSAGMVEPQAPEPEPEPEPEWLRQLQNAAPREAGEPELGQAAEPGETPPAGEADSEPEWLKKLQAAAPREEENPETEWLPEHPGSDPPEEEKPQPVPPFVFDPSEGDLDSSRGWTAEAAGQGSSSDLAGEEVGPEPGLAPADLPPWLAAMRPVEAAAPSEPPREEADLFVEGSGPLSGLSGVLPAEPDIARQKRPPAYSVKLRVSESQQAHADLFAELIKAEGAARPVPSRPVISSQHLLRLAVFFVLLLSILWTLFNGGQSVPLPEAAVETAAFSDAVSSLSPGSPVLVAVDYQPGLSAEMDALAATVLDHLMRQEAYLALVSTTPTGPAQAGRLLGTARQSGGQYANLGFIPGGPAGILGFAESPRRMMPFSIDGGYPWLDGPLASVSRLDQFALAVVITEDPDTARAWIEQARPALGDTPLLMALSAQAEPFVRPYYEGDPSQVQAILSGLAGAASYENLQARPGLARRYWDAYSFSLPLAAALILFGGAVYAGTAALADRRKSKPEASA